MWLLRIFLSIYLVSQILTTESSDIDMKWVQWPSLGYLLSTLIVGGTNAISATNCLWEVMILD